MNKKEKSVKFYAYKIIETNEKGIFDNWPDCQKKVNNKVANYKKFNSKIEAKEWLDTGANYSKKKYNKKIQKQTFLPIEDGIYFDAGTGRGKGVEVRITDKEKNSLIDEIKEILDKTKINIYKNYHLGKGFTNNYGELKALYVAINLAIKKNIKNVYGDSKLVIDYWSKGRIKDEVAEHTKELAKKVTALRKKFELSGGKIIHISGDINPADLGFHK